MPIEIISVRRFKAGYEIRTERYTGAEARGGNPFDMRTAYTPEGWYIGDPKRARSLCVKRGIRPQKISPKHNVCSIGKSAKDGKYYGWSHRAIFGFKIGSTVKKGDCTAEYLPVGFKAKTEADAKKMAIAFARSVS